jgi:hypothetical protein
MRKVLLIVIVVAVTVLAIGVNRIVVTAGGIDAIAMHEPPHAVQAIAFKSDYFPLERRGRA